MKLLKTLIFLTLLTVLTSCHKPTPQKDIHELLLSIRHYACRLDVTLHSNKTSNTYTAIQEYNADGSYYMEFLDPDQFKIQYNNLPVSITCKYIDTKYNGKPALKWIIW